MLEKIKEDLYNVHSNHQNSKPEEEEKKDQKYKSHDVYKCFSKIQI